MCAQEDFSFTRTHCVFIVVMYVFTRSRQTRRELGDKELGKSYDQPEQVITRIKNYDARPSALPFLTSIPEKIPWEVLWDYDAIHKVRPSVKAVPADQRIGSLGTYIETFKRESLTTKEEEASRDDDAGVH